MGFHFKQKENSFSASWFGVTAFRTCTSFLIVDFSVTLVITNDNVLQIVGKILHKMPTQHGHASIEDHPDYLMEAIKAALTLRGPVKGYAELRF